MKNIPTTDLKILREQRINDDLFGVKFGVEVKDAEGKLVQWQPFKLNTDGEIIIDSMTDDEGKFEGQKVLNIRKGTQRKVELVLESGEVVAIISIPIENEGEVVTGENLRPEVELIDNLELSVKAGETKTLKEGIHKIEKDILVEKGGRLVIEPGAKLEFSEEAGIISMGKLIAVGTAEKQIIFTNDPEKGKSWRNICIFGRRTVGSRLEHCVITNGTGI